MPQAVEFILLSRRMDAMKKQIIWRNLTKGNVVSVQGERVFKRIQGPQARIKYWEHRIANALSPGSVLPYIRGTNFPAGNGELVSRLVQAPENAHAIHHYQNASASFHECPRCMGLYRYALGRQVQADAQRLRKMGIEVDASTLNVMERNERPFYFEVGGINLQRVREVVSQQDREQQKRIEKMIARLEQAIRDSQKPQTGNTS